ncbi:hypothetical protein [Roseobacter sp. EG26]|uniref:hypothetical protein n=1 Tax=Roseobacter sp. EG26 TaxID=3412477 RepID=UPI003CE489F6
MRRWYSAHIVLAASHVALERQENAVEAVKTCRNALPEICIKDLDRAPLRDHDKLNELRARLFKAGFA